MPTLPPLPLPPPPPPQIEANPNTAVIDQKMNSMQGRLDNIQDMVGRVLGVLEGLRAAGGPQTPASVDQDAGMTLTLVLDVQAHRW